MKMERGQKDDTDIAALLASLADQEKASFDVLLVDEAIGALMSDICGLGFHRGWVVCAYRIQLAL